MKNLANCLRCDRQRTRMARGLCPPCFNTVRRQGRLDEYPLTRRFSHVTAADYAVLVRRYPDMPNREIAQRLGMNVEALTRALNRARKSGALTIWRITVGRTPEIARRGERRGVPA